MDKAVKYTCCRPEASEESPDRLRHETLAIEPLRHRGGEPDCLPHEKTAAAGVAERALGRARERDRR